MYIEIDFDSEEAIYMQLRNQIIMGIAACHVQEGESLPSVRSLAGEVGINMHTVNKAYAILKQEGFISLDKRRGAVVAMNVNKEKAKEKIRNQLTLLLAQGLCHRVTRKEFHEMIDEIYEKYSIDQEGYNL